ncbi:cytoplasmic protein [Streptomyces sp. NPDC059690]|uniref:cytoplasmic protein n=1 Tax=Streptomyces sp. NPDC059690 TaxID=3346907 RepID=UPI0036CAF979
MNDPVVTDPQLYRVVWENERVRVLEYRDAPGDATHLHAHPDSVMVTLSSFQRVIAAGGREVPVALEAGQARWLDAQEHQGRNVGRTATHSLFIELKEPRPGAPRPDAALGPSAP